jgi:hypothetical protein
MRLARSDRLLWFAALYVAGVVTLAAVAFGIRALLKLLG